MGVTEAPFHVLCRSTICPWFDEGFGGIGESAARGEGGKTYYVPEDMSFGEWKKAFVEGGDKSGVDEAGKDNVDKSGENGIIKTGGKITENNFTKVDQFEKQAKKYYEERLQDNFDVISISNNTKFSVEEVLAIKNHIMSDIILFSDGSKRKFDPDIDQALAWKRLIEGNNIKESDIILLEHEFKELTIMKTLNATYEEAHKLANHEFNWEQAIENFIDTDELY